MRYPIKLTSDDNGTLLVTFPDFDDAVTFGENEADALARASNALDEVLASRIAAGLDVPEPSKRKAGLHVSPSALTEAKALLYLEMRKGGVRKAELARRLSVQQGQVDRLLDVRHRSGINDLAKAFAALGRKMTVQVG